MRSRFPSIEQRVAMFQSFYRMENERPLLGFFVGSEYPVTRYPSMSALPENRPLVPGDFPIEGFLSDSESLSAVHERCGGDFIWSASAYWGIPWLEAALGCPIFANHTTGSILSEPLNGGLGQPEVADFDEDNPWITLMGTMLDHLTEVSSGRWPIGTTRMRGISDLLSALYGGTESVIAMLEEPDSVLALCDRLVQFWVAVAQFQLDRIPLFNGGIGSFYYNAWAPPGTVWCQEDSTTLLSPELYDRYVDGPLGRIVDSVPGAIMHQHSTGFVPTDAYLRMPFHAMELHIDEGGPTAEDLFDRHQMILEEKPLIIWGDMTQADLDWIFGKLPPRGLAVITVVSGEDDAESIWSKYVN